MSASAFLAIRVLATAADVVFALAAVVHLGRSPRPLWLGTRIALAVLLAGALFAVKAPFLFAAGVHFFGLVHLVYLDLLLVPPLVALAAYLVDRRRGASWTRHPLAAVATGLIAAATPVTGAYATFVEPFDLRLEITHIPLAPARRPSRPIRVGVLADIQTAHVTAYEHAAVDRLMAEHPDVILLPGDLFHGGPGTLDAELGALRALMGKLSAPGGVFFVLGDAERGRARDVPRIFAGTAVQVLVNQAHRTVIHGRAVTIAGVQLDWRAPAARALMASLEAPGGDDLRILVSHRPDPVLAMPRPTRVDLVVAGHTHGGQVRLPLLGPPVILSRVPRAVGGGGYHLVGGRPIYVSRGVGHEGGQAPRIRFLCPPEASLLLLGEPGGAL
jgi:predicted MPP superfamily phosphohydrolase